MDLDNDENSEILGCTPDILAMQQDDVDERTPESEHHRTHHHQGRGGGGGGNASGCGSGVGGGKGGAATAAKKPAPKKKKNTYKDEPKDEEEKGLTRRKRADRMRNFQPRWTDSFGFVEADGRALCVLCQETVIKRTYSVQRHFQTIHSKYFKDEEEKKAAILRAVISYNSHRTAGKEAAATSTAPKEEKDYATETSFTLSLCISEKGKPFTEGEFIKNTFVACAETLFEDFPNKDEILTRIKDIPASARTMQRRISEMASDVRNQQTANLVNCEVFSVAMQDSVDASDVRRLTVFVRYVAAGRIHEDLCYQKVAEKPMTGEEILNGFIQHFDQRGVSISKIASVMTDNSPCLADKNGGFVRLLQEKVKHVVISCPCILRQEDICTQISNGELKLVMETVVKIVNLITSRPTNVHDKFQELLNEVERAHGELSPRSNIRWLGNGEVLDRFIANIEEIRALFGEKWQTYPELWNDFWLLKLSFLADLVGHLNDLNSRLKGKGQTVEVLYEQWKLFTSKLGVFRRDIQVGAFRYFVHVRKFVTAKGTPVDVQVLDSCMAALEQAFYDRFQELQRLGSMFSFVVRADELLDIDLNPLCLSWIGGDNLEMELLELKVSDLWCSKFRELRKNLENQEDKPEREALILECWSSLPDKFANMKKVALALLTAFGSTNCAEQTMTYMKHSFNPLRCRLSTSNSETSARLKLTNYKPNLKKLCTEINSQGSH